MRTLLTPTDRLSKQRHCLRQPLVCLPFSLRGTERAR